MSTPPLHGRTGEYLWRITGLLLAGVIAYYTAIGTIQAQIAVIVEREGNHYEELLRRLSRIEDKLDRQP